MKKVIFSFCLTLLLSISVFAQSKVEFEEDKHDFGMINEGTLATYKFKFKNVGTDTITLGAGDVRASCGCTTPDWTKEAILPGGAGEISAQFNSNGRPGVFNKNVTVMYKGTVLKVLNIKGIVVKEDTTKYSAAELKKSAVMSLEKTAYNFGKVERGQRVIAKINLKNTGKDTLKINSFQSACSCITPKLMMYKKDKTPFEVKDVPPGKSAFLEIVYFSSFEGVNTDVVTLLTNDLTNPRIALSMTAEVVPTLQNNSPMKENSETPFK